MESCNWGFSSKYYQLSTDILNIALSNIAVYKPWKSFDPGTDFPIDVRYAAMPALNKKDIREHFPDGMLPEDINIKQGLETREIELVDTSGTTDDKITNIWNQKWWNESEKASWKLNSYTNQLASGNHREAILVNPRNVGIISDTVDLPIEKRRLSRLLYLNEKTDPVSWSNSHMDRIIAELNTFQPVVLEANPSYLARLCRYITTNKKKVFQPGVIVFTYEFVSLLYLQQIRKAFNVPTVSSYGTTETGYVFMQCENGKYHQNSDFCRVDFQPFKSEHGGLHQGRILVTPLNNPWSYLIRFDTGDIVSLEMSGKCSCGRNAGMILTSINGRKNNLTLTCDGRLVTLLELDSALSKLQDINEYQLVQTDSGNYNLYLVSNRVDKKKLEEEAKHLLKDIYGSNSNISVIHEAAIKPEGSGKYMLAKTLFPIEIEKYLHNI